MKKIFTVILYIVIFLILDNTFMPFIDIEGYYPSLLFLFSVSYSIIYGMEEAAIIGSAVGLIQDLYFTGVLGINAFCNLLVCLIAAKIGDSIFKEKIFIPTVSNFFLSIIKGLLLILISFFIKEHITFKSVLFISLYNFVASIFIYRITFKLSEKPFMKNYLKF